MSEGLEKHAVRAPDGVEIGYVKLGSGPAVVIVHGSISTHEDWLAVAKEMASDYTCYVMDRRGRGMSGDAPEHSLDREVADVKAMLDAAGPGAFLLGHSFGAVCSAETALRYPPPRLVLYEPPFDNEESPRFTEPVQAALDRDDPSEAMAVFFRIALEASEKRIDAMKETPEWEENLQPARHIVRERKAIDALGRDLSRYAALKVPTLLLLGEKSPLTIRMATKELAKAAPDARIADLEGQAHVANLLAPKKVAEEAGRFFAQG